MQQNFRLIAVLLFTSILFSTCNETSISKKNVPGAENKPELTAGEIKRLVLIDTSFVYPEKQARINVVNYAKQFLAKDGIARTISGVTVVKSLYSLTGKTSIKTDFSVSKPQTPSMYVYNFSGKNGFAIVSADKRAPELLAISGSGTIDSLMNPGLRVYIDNAIGYMDTKVGELESLRGDETFQSMLEKLREALLNEEEKAQNKSGRIGDCNSLACGGGTCTLNTTTVPIGQVTSTSYIAQPLLTTLWHQRPPYNDAMGYGACTTTSPCGSNANYLSGCVPTAEGQVVAYFRSHYDPAWQSITSKDCHGYTSGEASAVASMEADIFNQYAAWGIFAASAGCQSTGAGIDIGDFHEVPPMGIAPYFGLVQGEWRSWNTGDIRNSLSNASPVVIMGFTHLWCSIYCFGYGNGHEWVIDGMRDENVTTTYNVTAFYSGSGCTASQRAYYVNYNYNTTSTTTKIHQNWGWGPGQGSDTDDWYLQEVFQSNQYTYDPEKDFNHSNYIIAYITPL